VTRTMIKLGAFAAVCLLLTAYLAFTIGNIHPFQRTYRLSATFDDVTGLLKLDNVKVAGVPVGKVTGVRIVRGRARVTFSVRSDVHLPVDSKAAVRWRNLLGQRYVYIYPGTARATLRPGQALRHTASVVDLGALFNRLGPIIQAIDPSKVNQFLDTVAAALDGNEQKVRQAVADLSVFAQAVGERDAAIGRVVGNLDTVTSAINSRDAQIREVIDNLLAVARTFNENTGVLDSAATDLSDFTQNLGNLVAANRTHLDSVIGELTTLAGGLRVKLPTIDDALSKLDETSRSFFDSSRFGQFLDEVVPCGAAGDPKVAGLTTNECVTGLDSGPAPVTGTARTTAPARPSGPTRGARAVVDLVGGTFS